VGQKRDYDADDVAQQRQWLKRLAQAGLSGVAWPTEYGGRGATPMQQIIFHEEHQRVGGRGGELFFVGLSHAGPTLIEHGTDTQRRQWLPGILNGDILFAQCFSEPGAGSDLASITTRGTVDADDLVVTGEKRWSTHVLPCGRSGPSPAPPNSVRCSSTGRVFPSPTSSAASVRVGPLQRRR
jgi:alkylation response protein AidB-like acyl-CoA dehydrogenase